MLDTQFKTSSVKNAVNRAKPCIRQEIDGQTNGTLQYPVNVLMVANGSRLNSTPARDARLQYNGISHTVTWILGTVSGTVDCDAARVQKGHQYMVAIPLGWELGAATTNTVILRTWDIVHMHYDVEGRNALQVCRHMGSLVH